MLLGKRVEQFAELGELRGEGGKVCGCYGLTRLIVAFLTKEKENERDERDKMIEIKDLKNKGYLCLLLALQTTNANAATHAKSLPLAIAMVSGGQGSTTRPVRGEGRDGEGGKGME